LHIHDGSVSFPLPCVLGHEISGVVAEVGVGVEHVKVGQRVVGAFIMPCGHCAECRGGRSELCVEFFAHNRLSGTLYDGNTRLFDKAGDPVWMYSMGGMSELAVMPALAAVPLPDALPLAESAILGCAFLTAMGAANRVGEVGPGATVAVFGAGGVGSSLIQVCKALGASRVIAVDLDDTKLAAAKRLGADDVVNASGADPVAAVRELTDGRGVDVAFEAIGRPVTFRQAGEVCADGATAVMVGIAPTGALGEVEITRLVRRKLRLLGSYGGRPQEDLPVLMGMAADGRIDLAGEVSEHVPLEAVDDVFTRLRRGEILGRAVVEVRR
ncbi:MAG: zinc-binding dehydrogenase, partial [Acidimicrobiaceae bacterium]|nr:zinc-binding dehydrogenase [Acidimicrobiaceae bacterium]